MTTIRDSPTSLRETAREAVRAEVQRHAWRLFSEHGFAATTVDQIAAAAGMSRRTFFRYFASKDDLVLKRMLESTSELERVLAARPADEPAWPALRAAFDVLARRQSSHAAVSRRLQLMLYAEDPVRAIVEEWRRRWTQQLLPHVAQRLPEGASEIAALAVTISALGCLEVAQQEWAEHPGADLAALLDEAMGAVAPL
ncbi:TetR family transcriptional regulator [Nocardioides sp.]|uniref:TetR family transcriptional regulator n=1 Tax=Nocardioides sp. TaxID=35761 RepID=UPI0039E47151